MKLTPVLLVSLLFLACGGDGPDLVGAPGVTIEEIAVYQGVKRGLLTEEDADIPIVAGRDALFRVHATGDQEYNGQPILARLTLVTPEGEPEIFEETVGSVPVSVNEEALGSTINFWISGEHITPETNYRLELLQEPDTAAFDNPNASYPVEDKLVLPLGATAELLPLEVVLVPVSNQGRKPDVSDAQVELYRKAFLDQYPATEVNITVRESVEFDSELSAQGAGWSQLLNSMASLRSSDGVGPEVYYYGIFKPDDSFNRYCSGGCILGLGFLPGPEDIYMRAAIGLGYTGEGSVETAIHEIGHTHGRQHAPCGVDGADPQYPHQGASIGTFGLSLTGRDLKNPATHTDFMGYCSSTWVSDYTYKALYERMRHVDGQRSAATAPRTYGRVAVGPNGDAQLLDPVTAGGAIEMDRTFTAWGPDGVIEGSGHFVPYDHLEGGVLLVPEDLAGLQITGVELGLER